jgi:hypothetical protein
MSDPTRSVCSRCRSVLLANTWPVVVVVSRPERRAATRQLCGECADGLEDWLASKPGLAPLRRHVRPMEATR